MPDPYAYAYAYAYAYSYAYAYAYAYAYPYLLTSILFSQGAYWYILPVQAHRVRWQLSLRMVTLTLTLKFLTLSPTLTMTAQNPLLYLLLPEHCPTHSTLLCLLVTTKHLTLTANPNYCCSTDSKSQTPSTEFDPRIEFVSKSI